MAFSGRRRHIDVVFCILVFCFVSNGVLGASPEVSRVVRAQKHVDTGDTLFAVKRFEEAIAEYVAALSLSPHPDLVWKIGRAHEEAKRYVQAIHYFRQYLALDISQDDRAAALKRMERTKPLALETRRGSISVTSPAATCVVLVGGVRVGEGVQVVAALKPGRYRVAVKCPEMKVFESFARVVVGKNYSVDAKPEPLKSSCPLSVSGSGPISVYLGGASRALEYPWRVPPGDQSVRVASERRQGYTVELRCLDGEAITLEFDLGPVRHPEVFQSIAGTYRISMRPEGGGLVELDGGTLVLDEKGQGTLIQNGRRALKAWRVQHCGGRSDLTWTRRWVATYFDGVLRLKSGKVTECSCNAYCQASDELAFSALRLPGYEGFISEGVYVIRSALPGAGDLSIQEEPWLMHDKWVAEIWPNGLSDVTLAVAPEGTAVLQGRMTGMVPSYLRGKCKGHSSFSQTVRYAGVVAYEEDGVKFTPSAPVV